MFRLSLHWNFCLSFHYWFSESVTQCSIFLLRQTPVTYPLQWRQLVHTSENTFKLHDSCYGALSWVPLYQTVSFCHFVSLFLICSSQSPKIYSNQFLESLVIWPRLWGGHNHSSDVTGLNPELRHSNNPFSHTVTKYRTFLYIKVS